MLGERLVAIETRLTSFSCMPYGPFEKPLDQLAQQDLEALAVAGAAESLFLEFKQDLAVEKGELTSRWAQGHTKSIPEAARDKIAKEICAFANADGGTLLLGVAETKETGAPGRYEKAVPLPEAARLSDQLRRSLLDVIEPPLGRLEANAIIVANGNGVVVLRVPSSMLAPHRVKGKTWQCYVRREDESKTMTMREIQDMVLQREASAQRIEQHFGRNVGPFRRELEDHRKANNGKWVGWQISLIPLNSASLRLPRTRNMAVAPGTLQMTYRSGIAGDALGVSGELLTLGYARPILGGVAGQLTFGSAEPADSQSGIVYKWYHDGRLQAWCFNRPEEREYPAVSAGTIAYFLADAFRWVLDVRERSNDTTLVFGCQLVVDNSPGAWLRNDGYGASILGRVSVGEFSVSPIYEIGVGESFDDAVDAISQDIFSAFGADFENSKFVYRTT